MYYDPSIFEVCPYRKHIVNAIAPAALAVKTQGSRFSTRNSCLSLSSY